MPSPLLPPPNPLRPQNSLELLQQPFRLLVFEVLIDLEHQGFDPFVFETGRTDERQAVLVKKGASKRLRSLHQDGLAVDIIDKIQGWKSEEFFLALAKSAEKVGLVSGHRWKWRDSAHIEAPKGFGTG